MTTDALAVDEEISMHTDGKDEPCPVCGSPTRCESACPGWHGQGGQIMVCQGCGNAEEWHCTNKACGWWYREPNIRSDKDKMGGRPPWL